MEGIQPNNRNGLVEDRNILFPNRKTDPLNEKIYSISISCFNQFILGGIFIKTMIYKFVTSITDVLISLCNSISTCFRKIYPFTSKKPAPAQAKIKIEEKKEPLKGKAYVDDLRKDKKVVGTDSPYRGTETQVIWFFEGPLLNYPPVADLFGKDVARMIYMHGDVVSRYDEKGKKDKILKINQTLIDKYGEKGFFNITTFIGQSTAIDLIMDLQKLEKKNEQTYFKFDSLAFELKEEGEFFHIIATISAKCFEVENTSDISDDTLHQNSRYFKITRDIVLKQDQIAKDLPEIYAVNDKIEPVLARKMHS